MLEIIRSGGWVMWPILLCSVLSLAIIVERFWSLRRRAVIPPNLTAQVWQWVKSNSDKRLDEKHLELLRKNSPMGQILAAGLANMHHDREMMKAGIEEIGNQVVHQLERYLNTLGTIAEIAPLLGLLGTVTGIISMLAAVGEGGLGNPTVLSSGLAEALITTAAGLTVAIPTFVFYRYFRGLVDSLVVAMEQEALKLIDVLHGDREANS
ncbi:MotA/TolQ/ExbB proton channel family protein [Thioflexithrix psekupsensis]|uniref:Biopolymer transporter ExbB n=1 Tax=Thioflexithrix psekupsensis TaxID=1570016 RepID=A0A251X4E4_9GAMM|nr:MotA/TolQ/ExbB proton channel family protein [Thioflexithrix psekupsensis]OUD12364.1 biopolymer transporter ExbB [Thioflexithrix psekupsensis]